MANLRTSSAFSKLNNLRILLARLGPKRASKIRKLFDLTKEDDVRKYVVRRPITKDGKKTIYKAPKIQRLVTPQRLQHKRQRLAIKRERWEATRRDAQTYNALVATRFKEARDARAAVHAKHRSESRKLSEKSAAAVKSTATSSQSAPTSKNATNTANKQATAPAKTAEKSKSQAQAKATKPSTTTTSTTSGASKESKATSSKAAPKAAPKK